jgi:hypothetical protein
MKIPPELLTVAKCLGHLKEKTVFVGGMIRGLLITDPAAGAARPTDDVDLIVDVASYKAFTDLNEELRALGFNESIEEGAPICRWVVAGIRTDIMPIDPGILGFANVWYSGAMDHARACRKRYSSPREARCRSRGFHSRYRRGGCLSDQATSEPCNMSLKHRPSLSSFILAASTCIQACQRQSSRACSGPTPPGDTINRWIRGRYPYRRVRREVVPR